MPARIEGGVGRQHPKAPSQSRSRPRTEDLAPGRVEPQPLCVLPSVQLHGAPESIGFAPVGSERGLVIEITKNQSTARVTSCGPCRNVLTDLFVEFGVRPGERAELAGAGVQGDCVLGA